MAINPGYERDKMLEHYGKYSGGVDAINIVTGVMIPDIEADAWTIARRYEREREIG